MSGEIAMQPISAIGSYHAHVYYDPTRTRDVAERLRARVAERFPVQLGRWHDKLVGPHPLAMFQIAFDTAEFARLVPWLMLNREGLTILVHPNTANPRADHEVHALWLGAVLPLSAGYLPELIEDDEAETVRPNTAPTLQP